MSKKNKWTIVPFIFIATFIIALIYYLSVRRPSGPAEPLKAIPVNASLIIKINDFNALFGRSLDENSIWNELLNTPLFKRIEQAVGLYRFHSPGQFPKSK